MALALPLADSHNPDSFLDWIWVGAVYAITVTVIAAIVVVVVLLFGGVLTRRRSGERTAS